MIWCVESCYYKDAKSWEATKKRENWSMRGEPTLAHELVSNP